MNNDTINKLIEYKTKQNPDKIIFWHRLDGEWAPLRWKEYFDQINSVANYFYSKGLKKGDFATIISNTRYEWDVVEKALMKIGAIVVGIDVHNSQKEMNTIFEQIKVSCIIAEDMSVISKISKKNLNTPKTIITFDDSKFDTWNKIINFKKTHTLPEITADEPVTLIFTSGSTGTPKAIMYRHKQILAGINSITTVLTEMQKTSNDSIIAWLPLVNMTGRVMNLVAIFEGMQVYFVKDVRKIIDEIKEINPTFFLGVPRFYEKIYSGFNQKIKDAPPIMKGIFYTAYTLKKLHIFPKLMDKLVINKVKSAIFGKKMEAMICGTAPISKDIIKFFFNIGSNVLEAYAMSENTVPIAMNRKSKHKFGTVGIPLKENELKFNEEQEIFVKGNGIFEGYFEPSNNNFDREKFTSEGYFLTGDLGTIDQDGFLVLQGRKKDMIKTSTGNKIAPLEIEMAYNTIPYIDQTVIIGNSRKFITGIVTLNTDAIKSWCKKSKLDIKEENYHTDSKILQMLDEQIQNKAKELASYKQMKKYIILDHPLTPKTGELTVTLKIRRAFIEEKYKKELDALYVE